MAMTYDELIGQDVYDRTGDKIGTVDELYVDRETRRPEWLLVSGSWMSGSTFIPIAQAQVEGDQVRIGYDKETVQNAPSIDTDGEISEEQEARLYAHYGFDYGAGEAAYGETYRPFDYDETARTDLDFGRDMDTARTEESDEMTLAEERVHAGTRKEETGRVRLRKYVVTDTEQVTVPVEREEVRIEREPVTGREHVEIGEDEAEVTLTEERPVVSKETVPTEKVRLEKDTVRDEEQVSAQVRKERLDTETEGDVD